MSRPAQIPLDLGHRQALGRDDFLVMPSNELAVEVIDSWPKWQAFAIALCGPPGSGKSHLCQVWRARSGAVEIDAEALQRHEPPELIGDATCCVVDGVETAVQQSPELQRRLFHILQLRLHAGDLVLTEGQFMLVFLDLLFAEPDFSLLISSGSFYHLHQLVGLCLSMA